MATRKQQSGRVAAPNVNQWLEALCSAGVGKIKPIPEGYISARELGQMINVRPDSASRMAMRLWKAGKADRERYCIKRDDGEWINGWCYRLNKS